VIGTIVDLLQLQTRDLRQLRNLTDLIQRTTDAVEVVMGDLITVVLHLPKTRALLKLRRLTVITWNVALGTVSTTEALRDLEAVMTMDVVDMIDVEAAMNTTMDTDHVEATDTMIVTIHKMHLDQPNLPLLIC